MDAMLIGRVIRKRAIVLCCAVCGIAAMGTPAVAQEADDKAFVELIGEDLSNWTNPFDWGEATLEDGIISLRGDEKWFLVSDTTYDDFILEAEVRVPEGGNSGIQFRSHYEPNRLWGYQAEVDPSDRAWSGGLYDEGRRGWLAPLEGEDRADARGAFRQGEWNAYRIKAEGPHIQIWLNGVKTADVEDDEELEGYIALQHHGEDGLVYEFRNVRVKRLGDGG